MTDELKPCPFCGEQCANVTLDQSGKWGRYEPSCLEVRTGYDDSPNAPWLVEAAKAWNTRTDDARIAALEQRVRELEEALRWYARQADWCRKISADGDEARHNLASDGGTRARKALGEQP